MPLWDAVLAWRDRMLADPAFQRWAAGFPLTRAVSRRNAKALFDICAGFTYSQVLLACVRLRLLQLLADGALSAGDVGLRLSMPTASVERLLRAACALGLLAERSGDRYGLGMLGAAMLGNPAVSDMVEHHALLYRDLADPVALLQGTHGKLAMPQYWPYASAGDHLALGSQDVAGYSRLMSASQALLVDDILDAYPFERHRMLLDIGGGEGAFACAVARRAPSLSLCVFDLPAVAERARSAFVAAEIHARATAIGGSFRTDELPKGADVATLVRVLHDHDDEVAAGLLASIYDALEPGGALVIAEPMAQVRGAETLDAYFGLYLMAMGSGRLRSQGEISGMLEAAGFGRVRRVRTRRPLLTSMVVAKKCAREV